MSYVITVTCEDCDATTDEASIDMDGEVWLQADRWGTIGWSKHYCPDHYDAAHAAWRAKTANHPRTPTQLVEDVYRGYMENLLRSVQSTQPLKDTGECH
jgi:hypothetical protein